MNATTVFLVTVLTFAVALTAHVAIVIGLARRAPRWHALAAALFPPVGVAWSWRQRLWLRAALWPVAALGYAVVRVMQ